MPVVHGFLDEEAKQDHFDLHGDDFDAASSDEYEALAIAFLGSDMMEATMVECVRKNGDRIRFDKASQAFGVCDKDGNLRTFFKPSPLVHGHRTNLQYFESECGK